MMFSLEIQVPPSSTDRGTCTGRDTVLPTQYQDCMCSAMLDHFQRQKPVEMKSIRIEVKDKDGKTYVSDRERESTKSWETKDMWIYREAGRRMLYRSLSKFGKEERQTLLLSK